MRPTDSLGLVGKIALMTVMFLGLDRLTDQFTLPFLAVAAFSTTLVAAWLLDILTQVVSYYRHGTRTKTPVQVLKKSINRQTPPTDRLVTYGVGLAASVLLVSATLGTGLAPVDSQTPTYNVSAAGVSGISVSSAETEAANESTLGGSFERIRLDGSRDRITLFVAQGDSIDAVVITDPSGRQVASRQVSAAERRMTFEAQRQLTNGTYEIIGVGYDVNSENILLSRAEERESHEVRLNVTDR